jgi:peptide/nickel transport system permease protein
VLVPLLLLLSIILLSFAAPLLAPYDPLRSVDGEELQQPSFEHLFGTDWAGRDVFARVVYGGRATLTSATLAVMLSIFPGVLVGLLSGWNVGSIADRVISTLLDAVLAFPGLLLALTIITLIGTGPVPVAIAVGLTGFAPCARFTRASTIIVRQLPHIEAAYAIGAKPYHILLRHILPNIVTTLIGFAVVMLGWAIINAATLNFLGFGGDPASPEWGAMLAESRLTFRIAVWASLAPGLAITLTLLAVNLLADELTHRD